MNNNEFPCFLAGIVGGAMVLVLTLAWLNITPEKVSDMPMNPSDYATMISGFGGAVLGAVIGGLISWLLARQTANEARKNEQEKFNRDARSALLQVQLKTLQIANGLFTIQKSIDGPIERLEAAGQPVQSLWQIVNHTAGPHDCPKFEVSDYVPLANQGGADLISRLGMAADRYQATASGLTSYGQLRSDFQTFAEPYSTINAQGETTTAFPEDVAPIARLKAFELEGLIRQVKTFADQDLVEAKALCRQVNEFATAYLKDKGGFVKLEFDWEKAPENGNPA